MNAKTPRLWIAAIVAVLALTATRGHAGSQESIVLATTTSTQDTGLLDVLLPQFEKQSGIQVKPIAVGTGAALRMASTGDADVVLVHSPDAEKKYVDAGDLIEGRRIMHNDFVILGPTGDPASVGKQKSIAAVMRAIGTGGVFISRGDDSGTHQQEMRLWKAAAIDPRSVKREETGQGMGATLNVADQKRAYTLSDRGTYLALRKRLQLSVLFEGDPTLLNIYHAYVVNPGKHEKVESDGARAFVSFLVSEPVQRAIGEFKRQEYGQPLFVPDALPAGVRKQMPRE